MRVFGGIEGGSAPESVHRRELNPREIRREFGFLGLMAEVVDSFSRRKKVKSIATGAKPPPAIVYLAEQEHLDYAKNKTQKKKSALIQAPVQTSYGPFTPEELVRQYQKATESERNVPPLASYPFQFIQRVLSPTEQRKLLKKVPSEEALLQERFDLLHAKFSDASGAERKYFILKLKTGKYPALSKKFETTFETLLADGRVDSAEELMGARIALLGPNSIDEKLRTSLDSAKKNRAYTLISERDLVRKNDNVPVSAPDSIFRFYVDESIRGALNVLSQIPDFQSRAPTALKMRLAMLNEALSFETKETVWRLKRYVLFAIQSELTSQSIKGLSCYREECRELPPDVHTEDLYAHGKPNSAREVFAHIFADKEDVLNFLSSARARFLTGYENRHAYGGKAWVQIAETAYALWKEDNLQKLIPIADRAFQLEHNMRVFVYDKEKLTYKAGSLLDKDPKEFSRVDDVRATLDANFEAKDVAELFDAVREMLSPEATSFFARRAETVESLLHMASTYFPKEVAEVRARLRMMVT